MQQPDTEDTPPVVLTIQSPTGVYNATYGRCAQMFTLACMAQARVYREAVLMALQAHQQRGGSRGPHS